MSIFSKKQEPKLVDVAAAELDAAVTKFVNTLVERHEVSLMDIRDSIPQAFLWDARNALVQRIALARNQKQVEYRPEQPVRIKWNKGHAESVETR
jgi:hypothetical protein